MKEINHFPYLFWFCVGIFLFAFGAMMAILFLHIPDENMQMASNAQGFLQGSLIMSAVGFLLSGNINPNKKQQEQLPGTTTIDLVATATTSPEELKPDAEIN